MTTGRAAELLRKPGDPQQPTFLELFLDLVFVLALAQLSRALIEQLTWNGAFQTLVLLMALWWVWVHTASFADLFDPHRQPIQLVVTASMLGALVMGAVAPQAFSGQGLVFAGAYLAIQLGRSVFVVLVNPSCEARRLYRRQLVWFGASAAPWIAGALTHHWTRAVLWTLAVILNSVALALRFSVLRLAPASTAEYATASEHLAERYHQFFVIALGELILVTGLAFSRSGLGAAHNAALVVSFTTAAILWRIYISRAGELLAAALTASRDPVLTGVAATFAHLTMVAGIVVTAVGQELVITHPLGHTPPAWTTVLLGGPALFLAGRALFQYTVFARVSPNRPIGLLALAAAAPITLHLPPLLAATAATAILAAITIADAARARHPPPERPSPPGRRS